jgi:hypothetical protein
MDGQSPGDPVKVFVAQTSAGEALADRASADRMRGTRAAGW